MSLDKYEKAIRKPGFLDKGLEVDSFMSGDNKFNYFQKEAVAVFELCNKLDKKEHSVAISYLLVPLLSIPDISNYINLKELVLFVRNYLYEFDAASVKQSSYYL